MTDERSTHVVLASRVEQLAAIYDQRAVMYRLHAERLYRLHAERFSQSVLTASADQASNRAAVYQQVAGELRNLLGSELVSFEDGDELPFNVIDRTAETPQEGD